MKLPFFSSKGSASSDTYFGLFLKEHRGIGYIFSGQDNKLNLLAKLEFTYSNNWENLTEDVDEVLFKLENETKRRVDRTIFFLFSHFIDEKTKEIKKPYLNKIKDLTKNLEIKPIGYIECYEAVVSFIQERENAPLTSILIELDDTNVDVFIYKGGHKISNHIVARTSNIIDDLHSVFDTLGKNTLLPNRLVLYNSSNLVEESTKIISHRWSSELFVQLPRVEILKEEDILEGLQMLFEQQIYKESSLAEEESVVEETKEVLGFVVGKDIKDMDEQKEVPASKKNSFDTMLQFTKGIKKPKLNLSLSGILRYVYVGVFVLLFALMAAGFEFFIHKAQVKAVFTSQPIDKKINVDALIEEEKPQVITIHVATSSVEMKDVKITTGKRDIGEKAKGEVTLYNFDDKDKTFPKETLIQVDNLSFSLDDEVKVPASTLASDASAKLPGKAKAKVTASEIGTESNIDKGKRFKIADLSTSVYFAMNDNGFSGGTKKTIKTVSKKDMEDLSSSLLEKAKEQQKEKIYKTKDKHVTLIDSLMDFQLSNIQFSKEVGEESDNISLKAKVVAKYYYFENQEVNSMLKNELEKDIPDGYVLEDKNFTLKVDNVKENEDNITIALHLQAKATKAINMSKLKSDLRFKQAPSADELLKSEYGAALTEIEIAPPLPIINTMLPFFDKNIQLQIETQ